MVLVLHRSFGSPWYCRNHLENYRVMDIGHVFIQIITWLNDNWWSIQLSFFGFTFSVGALTAWVCIGSVVLWFVRMILGE